MTQPLHGLRLVVSGFELEQQEHRGIAVFTKGLLRALKAAGAEIAGGVRATDGKGVDFEGRRISIGAGVRTISIGAGIRTSR